MKRTNVMLTDDQHRKLSAFARKEGRTLGELVREAIDFRYRKEDIVEQRRRIALDAYQEGLISLGKFAEIIGLDTVSARAYLIEKGIALWGQELSDIVSDAAHA